MKASLVVLVIVALCAASVYAMPVITDVGGNGEGGGGCATSVYCSGNMAIHVLSDCSQNYTNCTYGCMNGTCVPKNYSLGYGASLPANGTGNQSNCTPTHYCLGNIAAYLDPSCILHYTNCTYGCSNGTCTSYRGGGGGRVMLPNSASGTNGTNGTNQTCPCTPGWACLNNYTAGFRGCDCSISNYTNCTNGCQNGACKTCTPGYICNGTSVMYRSYDCSLQLVQKCPYQCTNGGCIVPIGGGRKPIPVPIREEAQVIGPINNGQLFWLGLGVVVIAGVGIYAFMGSSKKK